MMRAMHISQHRATFRIELVTTDQPAWIEIEYDRSTGEDSDVRTFRPSFSYSPSDGSSMLDVFILTNKPWRIRTPGDTKIVDLPTEAYLIGIDVGQDAQGYWLDAGTALIVDKLSVDAILPLGQLIPKGSEGLEYHPRLESRSGSSKVSILGLPPLPDNTYVLFEVKGIQPILSEDSSVIESYGIFRREV